jgi:acyl-coenzyme A thioesterase PaaI-like protein
MDVAESFEEVPYLKELGIEIDGVEDGWAKGSLELQQDHPSMPNRLLAQGAVVFALVHIIGSAVLISKVGTTTPTVDARINYLNSPTDDLEAKSK